MKNRNRSKAMKRSNILAFLLILIMLVLMLSYNANANRLIGGNNNKLIEVKLSFNYTTHIYFNSKVKYVDIGYGEELIWEFEVKMVKITLKTKHFSVEYTNMTVHTENGIYGFILKIDDTASNTPYYFIDTNQALKLLNGKSLYDKNINNSQKTVGKLAKKKRRDNLHLQDQDSVQINTKESNKPLKVDNNVNDKKRALIERALKERAGYYNIGTIQDGITVYLSNIYILQDSIYMKITYKNRSTLNFKLSYISFSVENKRKKKNTVVEEKYLQPLATFPSDIEVIKSKSKKVSIIYSLGNFIPTKKQLVNIYIGEEKGRIITFSVPSEYFLQAKKLK